MALRALKTLGVAAVAAASGLMASTASALSTNFDLLPFTGSEVRVRVKLTEIAGGKIEFNVKVVTDAQNPNTGDLRGLFFNIADNTLIPGLSATGANITATKFSTSPFKTVGSNSNNVNGISGNGFEGGVEIGTHGIGGDDLQETTFTLQHNNQALSLAIFNDQDFAARVMSVGLPGGNRNGSSKLSGHYEPPTQNPPPPPPPPGGNAVPEPVTAFSLGLALLAVTASATGRRRS